MRTHVFDMDGTLLSGTTASLLLADVLGTQAELHALEARFAAGGMSNLEFAQAVHALWGVVPATVAAEAFAAAPLLDNIETVLEDIHEHGEYACLITMSPDYFAELCLPLGFDAVFSSKFPREAGTALEAEGLLTFADKPRLTREFCAEHGCRIEEAIAYGDSASDVPLFEAVGYGISVNGDAHLAELSDVQVRGSDLYTAYTHARRHIDRTAVHSRG
jgi:phosphoserine phosphatase